MKQCSLTSYHDPGAFDAWIRNWRSPAPTTYQGCEGLGYQRWFKFKEAFSPSLVREIIESTSRKPEHIVDCCAGSGTTAMVARFLGLHSTSIEVNPFLADLIAAKLADYADFDLPRETARLLDRASQIAVFVDDVRSRLPRTFVEPGVRDRWIFGKSMAKAIEQLRVALEQTAEPSLRRLFRVALASVLIPVSNVRVDGKGRRYRSNWQERVVPAKEVRSQFILAMTRIVEDVYRFGAPARGHHQVLCGDARSVLGQLNSPFDLMIFSPPYPNSFDYTDIYNVELWMLGYLRQPADNTSLRLKTLRSHVQIAWEQPSAEAFAPTLTKTLKRLNSVRHSLWDPRLPSMVAAYFLDLRSLISNALPLLNRRGEIAMVVGNSYYGGILVDAAAILDETAQSIGLQVRHSSPVRVMRASVQHSRGDKVLAESLLVLTR